MDERAAGADIRGPIAGQGPRSPSRRDIGLRGFFCRSKPGRHPKTTCEGCRWSASWWTGLRLRYPGVQRLQTPPAHFRVTVRAM